MVRMNRLSFLCRSAVNDGQGAIFTQQTTLVGRLDSGIKRRIAWHAINAELDLKAY